MKKYFLIILLIFISTSICLGADSVDVRLIKEISMTYPTALFVQADYAYITDYDFGLRIFDVSIPSTASEIGSISITGNIQDVYVHGDYAYIAAGTNGLRVINISNPNSPQAVGSYTGCRVNFVTCDTTLQRAYITSWHSDCMKILDISTPSSPVVLGTYSHELQKVGCADGDYAYVCENYNYGNGFRVLDVSTPSSPFQIGRKNTNSNPCDISKIGNYCYLADDCDGVRVIDVSTPSSPTEVGYWHNIQTYDVMAVDNLAFAADYCEGLFVLDISSPTFPVQVGNYSKSYFGPEHVFKTNGDMFIYVIESNALKILEYYGSTGIEEEPNNLLFEQFNLTCFPVIFNSSCLISAPKAAEIKIFDITGNLINILNEYPAIWYPNENISPGVYFINARIDNNSVSKRVVYLK